MVFVRSCCVSIGLAIAFASARLPAAAEFEIKSHYTKQEFRIPMRDGVRLFTAVYVPKDTAATYPILLTRTPYSVAPYGLDAYPATLGPSSKFAQDGFIFAFQDVRGRFMSEGQWVEMRPEKDLTNGPQDVDESTDTYDTIDWLLKNVPQNNGKAGLIGTSYPGFYASAGIINAHPAIAAASPQAPMSDIYMGDDAYHNGAFFLIANFDFYAVFVPQHNPTLPQSEKPFPYGTNNGYDFYLRMGSLINSDDKYFKYRNPYWTDVIKHTSYDEFWKSRNILPHLRNIAPAILVVGGWFDAEDLSGTLKTFHAIEKQSPATIAKLVMGPWTHGEWERTSTGKLGDLSLDVNASRFFHDEIELPFFRQYLKGAPDPNLPKAYVFETGKNAWIKKDQWPPADTTPQRLYLQPQGRLSTSAPGDEAAFDEYISDPAHPVPFFPKPVLEMAREYMDADQRFVDHRSGVLSYRTVPFSEGITLAGPISPLLFVSTTGSDSDFVVKLIDVYPANAGGPLGGYEQLVRGEPFRGKFRNSFEHPEPFRPGEIEPIHFTMPDVYHRFEKGHRIMLQIQSSWFPLIDRNPQTFTDIPTAKPSSFVKARERIYRSRTAASLIEVHVEMPGLP